jgi:predicted chitinase
MEDVLIGNAGRACMDSANEVKPHPNTGMPHPAANRGAGGSDIALYAYSKEDSTETIVGKLNILSFDRQVKKVYIISVNNATLPDAVTLENELNRIYAPAVVSWDVSVGKKVNVTFPAGQMRHGGSGAFSVYNADQKSVLKAFGEMDKESLYLFFVEKVTGKEGDYAGYMPLQYQSGFIYDNPSATIIAHELAHGAFNLWHTFSSEQFIASQGATSNLLDYADGRELWKHQWALISDPQRLWFKSWQDEEEGEASWTIIDSKHTQLFNYVYNNNLNPYKAGAGSYQSEEWPATWTYSDDKPEELVDKVIKKLKKTASGKMVDTIRLAGNRIYVGQHTVEEITYATAIYSRKAIIGGIKKVTVSDVKDLEKYTVIKQPMYCETAFANYVIIAFYEDGEDEPSLIIQAAKKGTVDVFLNTHLEAWMKYVGVMEEDVDEDGFHCHRCGKDLTITHQDLIDVFPNSALISRNHLAGTYFQTAFEMAPLNSCYRIAHLLSQVYHESNGMQATEEFLEYSLKRLLDNFNTTSSAKMFFQQSFWDNKEYLKYAVKDIYEMADTANSETGDYDAVEYETYRYNNSSTDTIRIPVLFTLNKGKGLYKKVTLTQDEQQENKERWVNQVYGRSSLGNGGPETGDGYRYRGRGAIQLTGKDNYKRVGELCNKLFGTVYDFVSNPDIIANDIKANIYSSIGYILIAFPDLSLLDSSDVSAVTLKINSKGLDLPERKAKFDALIQTQYKCK